MEWTPCRTRDSFTIEHGADRVRTCKVLTQLHAIIAHRFIESPLEFGDAVHPAPLACKWKDGSRSRNDPLDTVVQRTRVSESLDDSRAFVDPPDYLEVARFLRGEMSLQRSRRWRRRPERGWGWRARMTTDRWDYNSREA